MSEKRGRGGPARSTSPHPDRGDGWSLNGKEAWTDGGPSQPHDHPGGGVVDDGPQGLGGRLILTFECRPSSQKCVPGEIL